MISECELFWRTQYYRLHRVRGDSENQSFREATVAALRFERRLHCMYTGAGSVLRVSSEMVQRIPIGTSKEWFYENTGRSSIVHQPHSLTSPSPAKCFLVDDSGELDEARAVLWTWSTSDGALFYTHSGSWLFVRYPDISAQDLLRNPPCAPSLSVLTWQDDIYSLAHVVFGGCPNCRLVVRVTKHICEGGQWTVEVVKLLNGSSERVQIETLSFHFLPDPQLQYSCLFTVLSAQLHPSTDSETPTVSSSTFCQRHFVFLQIGTGVIVNQLSFEGEGFELSDPLKYTWTDFSSINPSNCMLSEDQTMVVFMPNLSTLCAWDLHEDVTHTHTLSPTPQSGRSFVAHAGKLYSMVVLVSEVGGGTLVEVHIVSTTTGRTVLKTHSRIDDVCLTVSMALSRVCVDSLLSSTSSPASPSYLSCEVLGVGVGPRSRNTYLLLSCC